MTQLAVGTIVERRYSPTMYAPWVGIVLPDDKIAWYINPWRNPPIFSSITHKNTFEYLEWFSGVPDAIVVKAMEVALCDPLTISSDMLELPVTKDE